MNWKSGVGEPGVNHVPAAVFAQTGRRVVMAGPSPALVDLLQI